MSSLSDERAAASPPAPGGIDYFVLLLKIPGMSIESLYKSYMCTWMDE